MTTNPLREIERLRDAICRAILALDDAKPESYKDQKVLLAQMLLADVIEGEAVINTHASQAGEGEPVSKCCHAPMMKLTHDRTVEVCSSCEELFVAAPSPQASAPSPVVVTEHGERLFKQGEKPNQIILQDGTTLTLDPQPVQPADTGKAPTDKDIGDAVWEAAKKSIAAIYSQREEILSAIVAKYGYRPECLEQVIQAFPDGTTKWWVQPNMEKVAEFAKQDKKPSTTGEDERVAVAPEYKLYHGSDVVSDTARRVPIMLVENVTFGMTMEIGELDRSVAPEICAWFNNRPTHSHSEVEPPWAKLRPFQTKQGVVRDKHGNMIAEAWGITNGEMICAALNGESK